ncbi:MAG: orotate phosphoribosyltransferase [Solirubrobacteraceae bacterium]
MSADSGAASLSGREQPGGAGDRAASLGGREQLSDCAAVRSGGEQRRAGGDGSLAQRIYARSHLTGSFTLRSGASSSEYFDKYLFESDPAMLRQIAGGMVELLPEDVDALAGLELGGVPLATAASQICRLPTLFVRKEAKTYGTCKLAEGGELAGRRLAVFEDVITSGGQVIASCRELRNLGAEIAIVLCVIDREAGGVEALATEDLPLRSLFTMSQLKATAGA